MFHFDYLMNTCTNLSWEWQRQSQKISYKKFNVNVNEDFVMFLISKLIACFINGFTFGMKSQSIAWLPIGSAHIYWILDLEGKVHSIWDLSSSGLQECKGHIFFEVGRDGQHVLVGFEKLSKGLFNVELTPQKFVRGCLMSAYVNLLKITRLIVMGWQPMMHILASIWGIAFYV